MKQRGCQLVEHHVHMRTVLEIPARLRSIAIQTSRFSLLVLFYQQD